jgi:hypothetical protein
MITEHLHHPYEAAWSLDHQGDEPNVAAKWYGRALEGQWGATTDRRVDWSNATAKCSVHTSSYTPDQDAHDFWSDVTNEVSSSNYTSGGYSLTGKTVAYDTGTNETRLDAGDPTWSGVTFTASYAVVYVDTGGNSTTDPVQVYVDFQAQESVSNGQFTLQWDATGVAKITAS